MNATLRRWIPLTVRDRMRPYYIWCKQPVNCYVQRAIVRRTGCRVASGPFRGMAMPLAEIHMPKLLGTYEMELHAAVAQLTRWQIEHLINIGAAEGYYAVGLARSWPGVRVSAFESDPGEQQRLQRLAAANAVSDRVTAAGTCTTDDLRQVLEPARRTLILMDVEGSEIDLLDPALIPRLRQSFILVELHEMFAPGCTRIILDRFRDTHRIERYSSGPRTLACFPLRTRFIPSRLTRRAAVTMITEDRAAPQDWFLMLPRDYSERLTAR